MATITLPPELLERIEKVAQEGGEDVNALLNRLISAESLEDTSEVSAALQEAQAIAERINHRLDNIHVNLQTVRYDLRLSIENIRESRKIAAMGGEVSAS